MNDHMGQGLSINHPVIICDLNRNLWLMDDLWKIDGWLVARNRLCLING